MDMRKDIDGLAGVVQNDMQLDPTRRNGVFIFLSKKRNLMKILTRGLDRFELLKIRLDKDKFLEPIYDEECQCVRLTWSDFNPYLDRFKGYFTTDGYIAYKIYEKIENASQKRCACLTHIRRYFVDALYENKRLMSWFINKFKMLFEIEAECKEKGLVGDARKQKRIEKSSAILQMIEDKFGLVMKAEIDKLGNATKSALNYIEKEWKAMKRIIESGEAEISNNLCEQMMRHIKINLRNSQNIGSEKCAKDFCFMYSLIESCRFNQLSPIEYICALLKKLPTITTNKDIHDMLPCYYKH